MQRENTVVIKKTIFFYREKAIKERQKPAYKLTRPWESWQ